MTLDIGTVIILVSAALFQGGQIATLAAVVRSNRDQGRRLGELDKWRAKREAVAEYKTHRHLAPAAGVPITED